MRGLPRHSAADPIRLAPSRKQGRPLLGARSDPGPRGDRALEGFLARQMLADVGLRSINLAHRTRARGGGKWRQFPSPNLHRAQGAWEDNGGPRPDRRVASVEMALSPRDNCLGFWGSSAVSPGRASWLVPGGRRLLRPPLPGRDSGPTASLLCDCVPRTRTRIARSMHPCRGAIPLHARS